MRRKQWFRITVDVAQANQSAPRFPLRVEYKDILSADDISQDFERLGGIAGFDFVDEANAQAETARTAFACAGSGI